jgi:hypothetical protein
MTTPKKVLWQPTQFVKSEFIILLDKAFAEEMMRRKISSETQRNMNKVGKMELEEAGIHWLEPYLFYEDTAFVQQVYMGQNGKWLSASIEEMKHAPNDQAVKYYTHNIDSSREAIALMRTFNKWIEYSHLVK